MFVKHEANPGPPAHWMMLWCLPWFCWFHSSLSAVETLSLNVQLLRSGVGDLENLGLLDSVVQ